MSMRMLVSAESRVEQSKHILRQATGRLRVHMQPSSRLKPDCYRSRRPTLTSYVRIVGLYESTMRHCRYQDATDTTTLGRCGNFFSGRARACSVTLRGLNVLQMTFLFAKCLSKLALLSEGSSIESLQYSFFQIV